MLLHYPPPDPHECIKPEGECQACRFFQHCRKVLLERYNNLQKEMKQIENECRNNSLGSLRFEEGGFTPD